MLERDIVRKIINYINKPQPGKTWKGYAWKNHGNIYSVKGLPDVMALIKKDEKSFFLCLEVKREGNDPTKLQNVLIAKLGELGAVANIVTTLDEVKELIKKNL